MNNIRELIITLEKENEILKAENQRMREALKTLIPVLAKDGLRCRDQKTTYNIYHEYINKIRTLIGGE